MSCTSGRAIATVTPVEVRVGANRTGTRVDPCQPATQTRACAHVHSCVFGAGYGRRPGVKRRLPERLLRLKLSVFLVRSSSLAYVL
jgi:hypothetical protein